MTFECTIPPGPRHDPPHSLAQLRFAFFGRSPSRFRARLSCLKSPLGPWILAMLRCMISRTATPRSCARISSRRSLALLKFQVAIWMTDRLRADSMLLRIWLYTARRAASLLSGSLSLTPARGE